MRYAPLILVVLWLGAGCAKLRVKPAAAPPPAKAPVIEPVITPVTAEPGKIAQVNAAHRFVVVDFGRMTPPAPGSRLTVHRRGQPVAMLGLTESARGRFVVADILEGDPRTGDEVWLVKGEGKP
ncbi:MAG: hypothetical protein FJ395_00940 [Verrucomicrobia bacterium]|nr:hypothetical protein [Verrucomicrobiota bacterium]